MKGLALILTAVLAVCVSAETVVKNSVAFAFPTTVGTKRGPSFQTRDVLFSSTARYGSRTAIGLSWSLPVKAEKGSIAIYSLAGTKVKTFAVTDQHGSVTWDMTAGKMPVSGVYLATLTCGTCKKNLQLFLSR